MTDTTGIQHGTSTGYFAKRCRCQECTTAARRINKRYKLAKYQGVELTVDATEAKNHLRALAAAGMSPWAITKAGGWKSRHSIELIMGRERITRKTHQRVMAITCDNRRDRYVDATGTRRRLQALACVGYSYRDIITLLGTEVDIPNLRSGHVKTVRARTADSIATIYDRVCMTPGTSQRSRSHAAKNGWVPPLAWDEGTIDNPAATPVTTKPKRGRKGVDLDDVRYLLSCGESITNIAERMGVAPSSIERAMYRDAA